MVRSSIAALRSALVGPRPAPEAPAVPWRGWLPQALGLYIACVVVLVAPALPSLGHAPVGLRGHHPYDVVWFYQATARALFSWPPSMHSDLLDYPAGLDLLTEWADVGSAVVAAPLTLCVGPFLSYNLEMMALMVLAGLSACWLTLGLTHDRVAGWVAGLFYIAMDPLLFAAAWGEDDVAEVWLLATVLALLWRTLCGRWREGLAVGAFIGLVGWFNSYYLYVSCLCTAILLGIAALRRPRPSLAGLARYALALAGAAACVLGPRFLLARAATRAQGRSFMGRFLVSWEDFVRLSPSYRPSSMLDLSGFLNPFSRFRWSDPALVEGFFYLGLGVLALAVVGFLGARMRARRSLALLGGLGAMLALGPYLQIEDAPRYWPGTSVPVVLPGGLLWELLPLTERMNHPFRFSILAFLAVAVLAGAGVSRLAERCGSRRPVRLALVVGLTAACLGERVLVSPVTRPLGAVSYSVPRAFLDLPEVIGRPALLHLPFPSQITPMLDKEPFRYHRVMQIMGHHRPLAFGRSLTLAGQALSREAVTHQLDSLAESGVGLLLVDHAFVREDPAFHALPPPWQRASGATPDSWLERNLHLCQEPLRAGELDIYLLAGEDFCGPGIRAESLLVTSGGAGAPEASR